jgi:uncharacterized membrane protein
MLWTLFVLLLLAWMICVLVVGMGGVGIHLLLVLAAIVLLTRLVGIRGKRRGEGSSRESGVRGSDGTRRG